MKLIKSLTVFACAFAFVASVALADDAKTDKKETKLPPCCKKAQKAGKECDHPCCVEAKKDGKVCEKCMPKKKKADAAAPSDSK